MSASLIHSLSLKHGNRRLGWLLLRSNLKAVQCQPSGLPPLAFHTRPCSSSSSSSGAGWGAGHTSSPERRKVDATTPLDEQRNVRRVEKKIGEHIRATSHLNVDDAMLDQTAERWEAHRQLLEAHAGTAPASGQQDAGTSEEKKQASPAAGAPAEQQQVDSLQTTSSNTSPALVGGRVPLRLGAPTTVEGGQDKDLILRSHTTTGQVLWPATQEDIDILSESKMLYPAPWDVEGSVIIRLVRLSDPVTSPVARVWRNRQFGIRGNEKWQLLAIGFVSAGIVYTLGFWQLRRMEWKKELIETRQLRLNMPRLVVERSPFPWRDQVGEYEYRVIEVRGVFDHRREMRVGPRPGMDESGESAPGYNIVTPLRLADGSTILVNRGHVHVDKADPENRPEVPAWVRVRGVLEQGELPNFVGTYARLKNRPDKGQFFYVIASDLAENAGARNHEECALALLTAIDVLWEDDFQAGVRRDLPFAMKHKGDYLLFWADEHTHFNYAMQWFGMGTLFLVMTCYKFIEVLNWRY